MNLNYHVELEIIRGKLQQGMANAERPERILFFFPIWKRGVGNLNHSDSDDNEKRSDSEYVLGLNPQ